MAKKGYKITQAVLDRLEKARSKHKNFKHSEGTKVKIGLANKANPLLMKPRSEEYKENLRKIALDSGFGKSNKGKKLNSATRKKMSLSRSGEKHWNWQGGKTGEIFRLRNSNEYKEWRTSIFKRDDYTCAICGVRGAKIQADHIKPFSQYPELRFDLDNGRTLCLDCHKLTPTYGVNAKYLKKENLL